MNSSPLAPGEMDRHLRNMRLTTMVFLLTVPVAVAALVLVPSRESSVAPMAVTLATAAAALWVGFTANRDAQARIDRIKRAYAAKGDESRLLRGHRLVNLAILVRLAVMVLAAVVAGIFGSSTAAAWGVLFLAAMMMGLSWPTEEKSATLLQRARELRGRVD